MVPSEIPSAFVFLDYVGMAGFAVTGALVAADTRQNFVTFIFFAVFTGVGGGTIRDLLIGAPVFWVKDNTVIAICLASAAFVWVFKRRMLTERAMLWFDAVGMASFAVYGTSKALEYGIAPIPSVCMGVITACAGGIMRDMLAGIPSVVLRPEIFVTAAALSAGLYAVLVGMGAPQWPAAAMAVVAGFVLRAGAIVRGWQLPAYKE